MCTKRPDYQGVLCIVYLHYKFKKWTKISQFSGNKSTIYLFLIKKYNNLLNFNCLNAFCLSNYYHTRQWNKCSSRIWNMTITCKHTIKTHKKCITMKKCRIYYLAQNNLPSYNALLCLVMLHKKLSMPVNRAL